MVLQTVQATRTGAYSISASRPAHGRSRQRRALSCSWTLLMIAPQFAHREVHRRSTCKTILTSAGRKKPSIGVTILPSGRS